MVIALLLKKANLERLYVKVLKETFDPLREDTAIPELIMSHQYALFSDYVNHLGLR